LSTDKNKTSMKSLNVNQWAKRNFRGSLKLKWQRKLSTVDEK